MIDLSFKIKLHLDNLITKVSVRKHDGLPLKIHENNRRITLVRKTGVTTGDVGNYKEETFKTTHDYELDEDGNLQLSTVYTKDDHWVKYSVILAVTFNYSNQNLIRISIFEGHLLG